MFFFLVSDPNPSLAEHALFLLAAWLSVFVFRSTGRIQSGCVWLEHPVSCVRAIPRNWIRSPSFGLAGIAKPQRSKQEQQFPGTFLAVNVTVLELLVAVRMTFDERGQP